MYVVDLHQKNETCQSACYNLEQTIKLCRRTHEKVICAIVGYGSSGGTHKIKTSVLEALNNLKNKNQIKGFILGSDIDIFNVNYQTLKGKELLPKEVIARRNPGEILIIL